MFSFITMISTFLIILILRWSNSENEFIPLLNKDYFIDKTMLIQDFIESKEKAQAVLTPSRFGKSMNLRMLEWFLKIPTTWDGNPAARENSIASKTFKKLKIGRVTSFDFDKHFGMYNVIYLDFRNLAGFSDFTSFIGRFRNRIRLLFLSFNFLLESKLMNETDKKYIDDCTHVHRCNYTVDEKTLKFCGAKLAHLLKKQTNHSCIVLIDALDAPFHDAFLRLDNKFWLFSQELLKVSKFMGEFVASLIDDNPNICKSYLTGTVKLGETYSKFSKRLVYKSLSDEESDPILRHYGFTPKDVEDLIKIYNRTERDQRKLELYFKGYRCRYTAGALNSPSRFSIVYNPENVVRFFWDRPIWRRSSIFELHEYKTTPDLMIFENLLNFEVTNDDMINCLSRTGVTITKPFEVISIETLIKFKMALIEDKISPTTKYQQNLTARDVFLRYLLETGMLTYKEANGTTDTSRTTLIESTWVVHDQVQWTLNEHYFLKRLGGNDRDVSQFLESVFYIDSSEEQISSLATATAKLFRNTEYPKTKYELITSILTFLKAGSNPDVKSTAFVPDGHGGILMDLLVHRYETLPIIMLAKVGTGENSKRDNESQSKDLLKQILDVNLRSSAGSFEAVTFENYCEKECILIGLYLNETHLSCSVLLYQYTNRDHNRELLKDSLTEVVERGKHITR